MTTKTKKQIDTEEFIITYKLIIPDEITGEELEEYILLQYPQLWDDFLNEKENQEILKALGKENHTVILKNIDFPLLKAQKKSLVEIQSKLEGNEWETIEGILNLADAITDQIEDSTQEGGTAIQVLKELYEFINNIDEDHFSEEFEGFDSDIMARVREIIKATGKA